MDVFKWLLKNLGWTYAAHVNDCPLDMSEIEAGEKGVQELFTPHWHTPKENCCYILDDVYSYEFVSKIPIEDWDKYYGIIWEEVSYKGTTRKIPTVSETQEAIHKASLDHRILALALSRGYHE